jgi:hypothetical protein
MEASPLTRSSQGLAHLTDFLSARPHGKVLDLGGVSQQNVEFIGELGHRLYSTDFLEPLDTLFGAEPAEDRQTDARRLERFLSEVFDFAGRNLDAVLMWNAIEHFSPSLWEAVAGRLLGAMKPDGILLAMFHMIERPQPVPLYGYRIVDEHTLALTVRSTRRPAQIFNTRAVERIFHDFRSVKFFLTRQGGMREVIVNR